MASCTWQQLAAVVLVCIVSQSSAFMTPVRVLSLCRGLVNEYGYSQQKNRLHVLFGTCVIGHDSTVLLTKNGAFCGQSAPALLNIGQRSALPVSNRQRGMRLSPGDCA
eukprot:3849307-Rhodomonas_salina.2